MQNKDRQKECVGLENLGRLLPIKITNVDIVVLRRILGEVPKLDAACIRPSNNEKNQCPIEARRCRRDTDHLSRQISRQLGLIYLEIPELGAGLGNESGVQQRLTIQ
jgi:hypothetical protein